MSKREFKVGERIVTYSPYKTIGIIEVIHNNGLIQLEHNGDNWYHPKQCRHIKPKEKSVRVTASRIRAIMLNLGYIHGINNIICKLGLG